jgi:hypothetical protein
MLRRFIIVGLAAALSAPVFAVTPASAAILFTCPLIDSGGESYFGFTPGLSYNQNSQDAFLDFIRIENVPCSNEESLQIRAGSYLGYNAITTFSSRPLGCPVAWGGAGPDYSDQTPILLGATDPSFTAVWRNQDTSQGIAKVKQGAAGDQWRLVFNITTGKYHPPAGKKTKIKFAATIGPYGPGTCADDSDPQGFVALTSVGSVIVSQK